MNIFEFIDLLSTSESCRYMHFKIIQLQLNHSGKQIIKIYFGNADEFVHAKILEEALIIEKIKNYGVEQLFINKKEVCAREGVGYKCLGMGRCSVKIATLENRSLWLFNFFGDSEYDMKIDIDSVEDRVKQFEGEYDKIEIEKQYGRGLYKWLPSENLINVRIRKRRNTHPD